nr:cytochrome P450 CYP749A22-like [Ipomoea batatas]GME01391.1 cytochrome P450 CYP749A22-like [Ipomoea batatas]
MNSSAPNSGMDRMDGFAKKAFGAVSGVASTAWGYAQQLPISDINEMDRFGKAFGAVSGVASAACGYAKQLSNSATVQQKLNILGVQSSQITDLLSLNGMCTGLGLNVKTVGVVATVGVATWAVYMLVGGLAKIVLFAACGVYKLVVGLVKIVCFAPWRVFKLIVGLVKKVCLAPWRVFKLHAGPGKKITKKMMKNPGRPWERIDANEFRNNPVARKAKFDRTHKLNKAGKCSKSMV